MWTQKFKFWIVPKYKGYCIMILAVHSREFGFGYPLKVPDLQTINEYFPLHPKYVDTESKITILGKNHKEPIIMGRNPLCQEF